MAGAFRTTFVTNLKLKLLVLNHTAKIYQKSHLANNLLNYNLIPGRDKIHELGVLKFVDTTNT